MVRRALFKSISLTEKANIDEQNQKIGGMVKLFFA